MSDSLERTIASGNFIPADLRLVLIGKTGAGKSSTCNTLVGSQAFPASVGASSITQECKQITAQRCGKTIQVVDTPGFFDTNVANEISSKITECVTLSSPGPDAILLVIRVGRFTEEDGETVKQVKKWFGDGMVNFMVVVFTGEDDLQTDGLSAADFIAQSPEGLKQLLTEANNRYLTVNNRAQNGGKDDFVQQLLDMVATIKAANGGGCYTTTMYHEAEQRVRDREAEEKKLKEREQQRQREDIERQIQAKYDGMIANQNAEIQKLQNEMSSIQSRGVDCSDKIQELQQKLQQVELQKTQMNQERSQWEQNLQTQAAQSENDRNKTLTDFRTKLDAAINKKESEVQSFSAKIEQERVAREQEMDRRAEEKRKREEEEHQKRMAAIAEQERLERERQAQIAQQQAAQAAAVEAERQRIEAENRRRRHRRRRRLFKF